MSDILEKIIQKHIITVLYVELQDINFIGAINIWMQRFS